MIAVQHIQNIPPSWDLPVRLHALLPHPPNPLNFLMNPARKIAIASGATRYKSWRPCVHGHLGERHTRNSQCCECSAIVKRATQITPQRKAQWRNSKRRGLPAPTRPEPPICECCERPPGRTSLHLDHCHLTHTFRGWLCNPCNRAIGMLGDTLEGVRRAEKYLSRPSI